MPIWLRQSLNTVSALNTESTRNTTKKSRDVESKLECNPNHEVIIKPEVEEDTVVETNIYCEFRSKDVDENKEIFLMNPIQDSSSKYFLIL